jgi:hypothetical protein
MICKECGAENPEGTVACAACGADFDSSPPPTSPVRPEAQIFPCDKGLRHLFESPDMIVKGLFAVAAACFIIGLAVSIWAMRNETGADSFSKHVQTFLSPYAIGIFTSGVVAGFALFIASLKRNAEEIADAIVTVLYIESLASFFIGMTLAILMALDLPDYQYSNPDKVMYALNNFIRNGLLYSGVIFGMAALVSQREDSVGSRWPLGKFLYSIALVIFLAGIAVASLQVNFEGRIGGNLSWVDHTMMFLYTLMTTAMLIGGIIAGFGGVVSYCSAHPRYYCTKCEQDVLKEWKVCPNCGDALNEIE